MPDLALLRPIPKGVQYRLSQDWGENPEWYRPYGLAGHNGLDYGAKLGSPVVAAHAGIASLGDEGETGYGRYVKISNGYMSTLYAHLSAYTVKDGQAVQPGDQIGEVGYTGNCKPKGPRGSHLHFGWKVVGCTDPAYRNYCNPQLGRRMHAD